MIILAILLASIVYENLCTQLSKIETILLSNTSSCTCHNNYLPLKIHIKFFITFNYDSRRRAHNHTHNQSITRDGWVWYTGNNPTIWVVWGAILRTLQLTFLINSLKIRDHKQNPPQLPICRCQNSQSRFNIISFKSSCFDSWHIVHHFKGRHNRRTNK